MTVVTFRVDKGEWELFKKVSGNASAALRRYITSYIDMQGTDENKEMLALELAKQKGKLEEEEARLKILETKIADREEAEKAREKEIQEAISLSELETVKLNLDKMTEHLK